MAAELLFTVESLQPHGPCFRGSAKCPSKGLYKGAGLPVSDAQGDLLDGMARNEQLDSLSQSNLAPPRLEVCANVFVEYPLKRPNAHSMLAAEGRQRSGVLRGRQHRLGERKTALVSRERYQGLHRRCGLQMQNDQIAKSSLMMLPYAQFSNTHCFKNQLTQQRRHVEDGAA